MRLKLFPSKELHFKLIDSQDETLNRFKRRTEESKHLTSQFTEKSFRGLIVGNRFKLISSHIGKGAFCVMKGIITTDTGSVFIEIHKAFRVLLSIFLVFPIIGTISMAFNKQVGVSLYMILVIIGQVLMIRYLFIEFAFRALSKDSLNRLRDVLDIEWTEP